MQRQSILGRALVVPALFLAFCSRGDSPSLTTPSSPSAPVAVVEAEDGVVGASAAGDVKNGPIEINLVKVSQIDTVPEPDQERVHYASAGGEYAIRTNLEVEIYVQIWTSDSALAEAPRLIVDWGLGGGVNERDRIHCGPCRLSRTYTREGVYTVTVTMDDRVGGVTSRTFTLNVANPPAPEATIVPCTVTPGTLTTLFAGGLTLSATPPTALYFDLTPSTSLALTQIDVNTGVGAGTNAGDNLMIDVYTRSGTYSGFEGSMAGWTLRTSGQGLSAGDNIPSPIVLNSPIALGPTVTGLAVVSLNFPHVYTATGSLGNFNDPNLSFSGGSSTRPFDVTLGLFTPRVPNMAFHYGCP